MLIDREAKDPRYPDVPGYLNPNSKMTALILKNAPQNARNMEDEKERTHTVQVVAFDDQGTDRDGLDDFRIVVPVEARWYRGRSASASVVHCSIWIRTRDGRHCSGYGSAGGGGYCKKSAAFATACQSAGIHLSREVSGAGMSAVRDVARAIAYAAGYDGYPMRVLD